MEPKGAGDVERLLGISPKHCEIGARFYLVDAVWLGQLKRYLKNWQDETARPASIDNNGLLVPGSGVLKERLINGFDYGVVPEELWRWLVKTFGGGPEICRTVVKGLGSNVPVLDVYPVQVVLSLADDETGEWRDDRCESFLFSKSASLGELDGFILTKMIEYGMARDEYDLYGKLYGNDFSEIRRDKPSISEQMIESCEWYDQNKATMRILIVRKGAGRKGSTWGRKSSIKRSHNSAFIKEDEKMMDDQMSSRKRKGSNEAPPPFSYYGQSQSSSMVKGVRGPVVVPPPASAFAPIPGGRSKETQSVVVSTNSFGSQPILKEDVGDNLGAGRAVLGVCGLSNLGNTCYMNAVIQCLIQTQALDKWLIDDQKLREQLNPMPPLKQKQQLILSFAKLTRMMWSTQHSVVTPHGFFNDVALHNVKFANHHQHDAQEFLSFLLDRMYEETNRVTTSVAAGDDDDSHITQKKTEKDQENDEDMLMESDCNPENAMMLMMDSRSSFVNGGGSPSTPSNVTMGASAGTGAGGGGGFYHGFSPKSSEFDESDVNSVESEMAHGQRALKAWQQRRDHADSLILDLFQGQYESRLQCEICNYKSSTFEVFLVLCLPITGNEHEVGQVEENKAKFASITLDQLLHRFTMAEHLDIGERWACPRCNELRPATKKITLVGKFLPSILVLQLKRFTATGQKINSLVQFPVRELNLEPYVMGNIFIDEEMPGLIYDLYAITRHVGTLESGHYTAHVLCSDNVWRLMDDSFIQNLPRPPDGTDPEAYLLYYRRRN